MTEPWDAMPTATMNEGLASLRIVGVVGAGQMGMGIAQVAAQAGFEVALADASEASANAGLARLQLSLARLVDKGKLGKQACDDLIARVRPVASVTALEEADLVIEAATENTALKMKLFVALDEVAKPGAILASNTSSISITRIASATRRPDRVAGMHFMNPVPLMKLCEIVRGLQSSDETIDTISALARKFGKTTILSRDVPGFLVNRILIPFLNEACFALQEGVGSAEALDTGARLGLNHPMGPLELADLIGLDTCLAIAEVLHRDIGDDKYRPATVLRNLVAAGWLGKKTGRGFYLYDEKGVRGPPTLGVR